MLQPSQLDLQLLIDFVTGQLGSAEDHQQAARIVRVIIAGNSVFLVCTELVMLWLNRYLGLQDRGDGFIRARQAQVQSGQRPDCPAAQGTLMAIVYSAYGQHLQEFDEILAQLAASVPVDLMPGPNDPSNHIIPQQAQLPLFN